MKTEIYSTHEARTKFSELLRKVRKNRRIVITLRGEPVAELGPVSHSVEDLDDRLRQWEEAGIITPAADDALASIAPIGRRAGSLDRFLADRD